MAEINWTGWVCDDCAEKKGWRVRNDQIVSCVTGRCPACGRENMSLTPEIDYDKPVRKKKKSGS